MPKRYVVTGTYVTFKTSTANGPAVLGFYQGAPVPSDAESAAIQHHLDRGLIAEVPDQPAPPPVTPAGQGGKDAAGGAASTAGNSSPAPASAAQTAKPATGGTAKGKAG